MDSDDSYEGDIGQQDYQDHEPELEDLETKVEGAGLSDSDSDSNDSLAAKDNVPLGEQYPQTSKQVEGFQLVHATGLTDTAISEPKGSDIPDFATASPTPEMKPLPNVPAQQLPSIPPPSAPECQNPLQDGSKSQQFNQRFDVFPN